MLECRKHYPQEEVAVFLEFVAMAYDETVSAIQVNKSALISFYQSTRRILEQMMLRGRNLPNSQYKIPSATLPTPGKRSMNLSRSPLILTSEQSAK